jgi:uncharacterized protein (TIGR03435 family)
MRMATALRHLPNCSASLDRPVIDKTGFSERFDMHLEFPPADATPGIGGTRPPIFTAIQEQPGLRPQAATGPVESLVIDQVERPSAN